MYRQQKANVIVSALTNYRYPGTSTGTRHSYGAMDLEQECVFIAVCLLRTVCMIVLDRHDHALVKYKSFFLCAETGEKARQKTKKTPPSSRHSCHLKPVLLPF